jgi:hypothetical protein
MIAYSCADILIGVCDWFVFVITVSLYGELAYELIVLKNLERWGVHFDLLT